MKKDTASEEKLDAFALGLKSCSYLPEVNFNFLYHYTSPEGFLSIIQNKTVYFTDSQFLNDTSELTNINEIYQETCKAEWEKKDSRFCEKMMSIHFDEYSQREDIWHDAEINGKKTTYVKESNCRVYVFSASINENSLAMWRYYAQTGQGYGYNIELSMVDIEDSFSNRYGVRYYLRKVIYDNNEKKEIIRKILSDYHGSWGEINDNELKTMLTEELAFCRLFFKRKDFEHENECRAVLLVPTKQVEDSEKIKILSNPDQQIKYRTKGHLVIPYIEVKLNDSVFAGVTVGPCLEQKIAEVSVNGILEQNDLHNLKIEFSDIPVRY